MRLAPTWGERTSAGRCVATLDVVYWQTARQRGMGLRSLAPASCTQTDNNNNNRQTPGRRVCALCVEMLRHAARRALSSAVPTTPPPITSRVQQIFEDHGASSSLADFDTKFKVWLSGRTCHSDLRSRMSSGGRCLQSVREGSDLASRTAT